MGTFTTKEIEELKSHISISLNAIEASVMFVERNKDGSLRKNGLYTEESLKEAKIRIEFLKSLLEKINKGL